MRALAVSVLVGCQAQSAKLPTAGDFSASVHVDLADTASDPEDSGTVPIETACEDPTARSREGPFEPWALTEAHPPAADWMDPMAGSGAAVGDLDEDGLPDIVLSHEGPDQLLLQTADGDFVDRTADLWPDAPSTATNAVHIVDLNGDGHRDVFTCGSATPELEPEAHLYLGDGSGRLTDATETWGVDAITRACFGASFGDIDGDGDLDVALAHNDPCGFNLETGEEDCDFLLELPSAQVVWEQRDGRLVDISDRFDQDVLRRSLLHVAAWVDIDADNDLDLYLVNDRRIEVRFAHPNALFENQGDGTFVDRSVALGLDVSIEGMGLGIGDLDRDERPDLLISGTDRAALLLSDGGGAWYDAAIARGIVLPDGDRRFGWGSALDDLDHDGDDDALMTFGWLPPDDTDDNPITQRDDVWDHDGGAFVSTGEAWGMADNGVGRGIVVADIDRDGWLDVLKRQLDGPPLLYRGVCGDGHGLRVRLQGPGANPEGIGARVVVRAQDLVVTRWMLTGSTGLGGNGPAEVVVGLGSRTLVDSVTVHWPDGTTDTVEELPADHRVVEVAHSAD